MNNQNPEIHIASGQTMGGPWQLRHVPACGIDPDHVVAQAFAALQRVDDIMSTFKSDSELMQLNRAETGVWLSISPDIHSVLSFSKSIADDTDGALDVTLGRVVESWGSECFRHQIKNRPEKGHRFEMSWAWRGSN